MDFVKKHDFKPFGWYRIVLGILVLLFFRYSCAGGMNTGLDKKCPAPSWNADHFLFYLFIPAAGCPAIQTHETGGEDGWDGFLNSGWN